MVTRSRLKKEKTTVIKVFPKLHWHYDDEFEGKRLVDNLIPLEPMGRKKKKVLVYSPKLRANILVYKNRLKWK
jgi:hypothetical protein